MANKELESKINALEKQLQELKEQIKHQFSEDEKIILRNIDKECKWIARDKNGNLFLYSKKPAKYGDSWSWDDGICNADYIDIFPDLFQSIKWEDEEPVEIAKVIGE